MSDNRKYCRASDCRSGFTPRWFAVWSDQSRRKAVPTVLTGNARRDAGLTSRRMPVRSVHRSTSSRRRSMTRRTDRPRKPSGIERAKFIPPMKALSVDTVPAGPWRLEVKLDGYRAIALINGGEIELWSRNRKPLTADYPEVVEALGRIRCATAVIDGEIVALDESGRSRFQLLQGRSLSGARPKIVYYVFDLLQHDGRSLVNEPIEKRQRELEDRKSTRLNSS